MMIFAIGEILIDFIAVEPIDLKNVRTFEKHAGGAPANMVVGLRRLNVPSALISKVGNDPFGEYLIEKLKEEKVNTKYIIRDHETHTGISFVQLKQAQPSFILYDKTAYFNLRSEEIDKSFLEEADLLHFGGVMLSREPSRSACFETVSWARERKIPISFDVNLRLDLWRNRMNELLKSMKKALTLAEIIKLGEGELKFLEKNGINLGDLRTRLIAITMGERGSELIYEDLKIKIPAEKVEAVDPTGAGDAYMAALLAGLFALGKLKYQKLNEKELELIGRFANIVAGISTTKRGAWSVPKISTLEKREELRPIVKKLKALS